MSNRSNSAVIAFITLLLLNLVLLNAQTCQPLPPASVCDSILQYESVTLTPAFNCAIDAEYALSEQSALWSSLAAVNKTCLVAVAQVMCQSVYTQCNTTTTCQVALLNQACSAEAQMIVTTFLAPQPSGSPLSFNSLFECNVSTDNAAAIDMSLSVSAIPIPSCQSYSGSLCAGIVDYPIYLPSQLTQSNIEATLSQYAPLVAVASTHNGCRNSLMTHLCMSAYLKCDVDAIDRAFGIPISAPFPNFVCQSSCENAISQCSDLFTEIIDLNVTLNCQTSNNVPSHLSCDNTLIPGLMDYPNSQTVFAALPSQNQTITYITTTCSLEPTNLIISPTSNFIQCPSPLVRVTDTTNTPTILDGSCGTPCPSILFSRDQWHIADILVTVLSVISFACLSYLFLSWTIFPIKRKTNHYLHMFILCQFIISLIIIISVISTNGKPSNIGCKNNSLPNVQSDGGICIVESMTLMFVTMAGVAWWMIIAFNLFVKIVLRWKITDNQQVRFTIAYHIFAWGVPAIMTTIALANQWLGRSSVTPWCFMKDDVNTLGEWVTFYWPIALEGIIGFILMAAVLHQMIESSRATATARRKSSAWIRNIRPLIFICQFFFVFVALIVFRAEIFFNQTEYTQSATNFINCLLSTNNPNCGKQPINHPSIGLWLFTMVCITGQGIIPFSCWATDIQLLNLWRGFLSGRGLNSDSSAPDSVTDATTAARNKAKVSDKIRSGATAGGVRDNHRTYTAVQLSHPRPALPLLNTKLTSSSAATLSNVSLLLQRQESQPTPSASALSTLSLPSNARLLVSSSSFSGKDSSPLAMAVNNEPSTPSQDVFRMEPNTPINIAEMEVSIIDND